MIRAFHFGFIAILSVALATGANAQGPLKFKNELIEGPATPADFPTWLAAMKAWRTSQLTDTRFRDANYNLPALQWARSSYIQPQMMVEDRYFYDPRTRRYTVKRYLDDLRARYGGIDSVLIWPTYPNIGIDDRNTDEMFRSMPGGVDGIKKMIGDFHREGVRVLFPIHPWDVGTHDPGSPWSQVLPTTMAAIGADGMNGDTMGAVTQDYFDRSVAVGQPLAFEPEGGLDGNLGQLGWNVMGWGYWDFDSKSPLVSQAKWLEPRHLVNVCDRWSQDKTSLIQYAFFNGVGVETWENVWGIWNQMTDRDAESVRRIGTIERALTSLLTSPDWEPFTPVLQPESVFASKWPGDSETLWTLVNRSQTPSSGPQLRVSGEPGVRYYDLWHGVELRPDGRNELSFEIEPDGYGAVLACRRAPKGLSRLLSTMRELSARPLTSFSKANTVLPQAMTPIAPTPRRDSAPEGMVRIPGAQYEFEVKGIEIEGENLAGVDVQYPWESQPGRNHKHLVPIDAFYIDRYPVTNAQFKKFMDGSRYQPSDRQNFLKDWQGGTYPKGWGNKPVTWVSLEDARAYAAWAGKRLPHEWEWQYAAQGTDGRTYPWGNAWSDADVPPVDKGRSLTPPADVDERTAGSPFGVMDLVGNVWQWTDEFTDDHTRAAILKGGSHYQPQGSMWYFPQAYRLDQHGKYLLMAPGRDRSACIGFRCVVDANR